jgi:outer membrane protein assembly factor BamB
MKNVLFCLLACCPVPGFAREDSAVNWNEFRGPNGTGLAPATSHLPAQWSETQNIRWKTPIHDKGWSSPVIWGKQIWLTTAREDGKEMFAVALDADSGSILHNIKVFDVAKPEFCHPTNSYASCSPTLETGRVYVHFGSYGTACLDTASGKKLWERRDLPCDHFRGPGSSPILHGPFLFLTFDGIDQQYLVALNKENGQTVWKTARSTDYRTDNGDYKKAYSTPGIFTLNGRSELVSPGAMATLAYDPQTGAELWSARHGGMNAASRILHGFGHYYLTTGDGPSNLIALRDQGEAARTISWTVSKTVPKRSSPILVDDLLYMVSDGGIFSCLEAKTGREVWQKRLGGNFWASPVCAGGRLFFPDQEGTTVVLQTGREFKLLAQNRLQDGGNASPAVYGNTLILRTRTHVYGIGEK